MYSFDLVLKLLRRNLIDVLFSCCVYISQDQYICFGESVSKLIKESKRPGICMRLEQTPQLLMRQIVCRGKCGFDLSRVMGIVIDKFEPVPNTPFTSNLL